MATKELPAGDWRLKVYGRTHISGQDRRRRPRLADRDRVYAAQNGRCLYCDLPIGAKLMRGNHEVTLRANWDHFVPFAHLARNPGPNWVLSCHVCNGIKSGRMFDTVQAARDAILPRRLTKGYEDPRAVLLRLAAPSREESAWPRLLRLKKGSTAHFARQSREGFQETACGREYAEADLVSPPSRFRYCTTCLVRGGRLVPGQRDGAAS